MACDVRHYEFGAAGTQAVRYAPYCLPAAVVSPVTSDPTGP